MKCCVHSNTYLEGSCRSFSPYVNNCWIYIRLSVHQKRQIEELTFLKVLFMPWRRKLVLLTAYPQGNIWLFYVDAVLRGPELLSVWSFTGSPPSSSHNSTKNMAVIGLAMLNSPMCVNEHE